MYILYLPPCYIHVLVFGGFTLILRDFQHKQSCYLQIRPVIFLPFQSVCPLSPFLTLVHRLELPAQCWIWVVRADILAVFLILGAKELVLYLKYKVSCRFLHMFFTQLRRDFIVFNHEWAWILSNFSSALIDTYKWFFFLSLLMWWITLIDF